MERERSQERTLYNLLATFLCTHYAGISSKSFVLHHMSYSVRRSLCYCYFLASENPP